MKTKIQINHFDTNYVCFNFEGQSYQIDFEQDDVLKTIGTIEGETIVGGYVTPNYEHFSREAEWADVNDDVMTEYIINHFAEKKLESGCV